MSVALALVALAAVLGWAVAVARWRRAPDAPEPARAVSPPATDERRQGQLDAVPASALVLAADGRILEANAAAAERFPFARPGLTLLEAFSELELAQAAAAALRGGGRQELAVRLFLEGRRTYRATVSPYSVGDRTEALLVLVDQTEALDYQELRSQFVANVSHELRTPLTGLRALLESLEDADMPPDLRVEFTARAQRETARLEALVADILLLSELEATQGPPTDAAGDLAHAATVACADLAAGADDAGVSLEVDAPSPVWTPAGEPMALTLVTNLVENAVRYGGRGCRVRVSVARDGDRAALVVEDDGAGIPESHLPHVFERFYRADPSRSARLGGTGLGLSIVKHVAERHGGAAEIASREGFGTTVRVWLPLTTAPGEAIAPP